MIRLQRHAHYYVNSFLCLGVINWVYLRLLEKENVSKAEDSAQVINNKLAEETKNTNYQIVKLYYYNPKYTKYSRTQTDTKYQKKFV